MRSEFASTGIQSRTNFKIQPIEAKGLDQAQYSFAKESVIRQRIPVKCNTEIKHIRINAVDGFVLKQEGNNAIPENQGDKCICPLRCSTPVNTCTAIEQGGSPYFCALY